MDLRESIIKWAEETFSAQQEFPWAEYPAYSVLRRFDNAKWFAVFMRVPRKSLGLHGDGELEVLNVKCDPLLSGSLREREGFLPAYHMSKLHWITICLDGSVAEEEIKTLIGMSFSLTAPTAKRSAKRKSGLEESGHAAE